MKRLSKRQSITIWILQLFILAYLISLYFKKYSIFFDPINLSLNCIRDYLSGRTVADYEDDDYNLRNFDYSKKICTSDFKYPWNTKRDLILTGGSYDFEKMSRTDPFLFDSIVRCAKINRASAPNCQIVFVLFNSRGIEIFEQRVANFNVTIYVDNSTNSAPSRDGGCICRHYYFARYLSAHRSEYDRVFFFDARDVAMFTDAFGTVDNETVHFITECHSNLTGKCNTFKESRLLRQWIGFYGPKVTRKVVSEKLSAVNAGFFYGPADKMVEVFTILDNETRKLNKIVWGADMAVLNYCYYMGLFGHMKTILHNCSNLVCFGPSDIHYNKEKKSLYQYVDGKLQCAPIIIHGTEYLKRDFPVM